MTKPTISIARAYSRILAVIGIASAIVAAGIIASSVHAQTLNCTTYGNDYCKEAFPNPCAACISPDCCPLSALRIANSITSRSSIQIV